MSKHSRQITTSPRLKVIIPTLTNTRGLQNLLADLDKQTLNPEIIVIDNAPTPEKKKLADNKNIIYAPQTENLGFAPAANLGAKLGTPADYYIFINDDIRLSKPDTLEKLIDAARLNHWVAVSPLLINPDRNVENIGWFLLPPGRLKLNFDSAIHQSQGKDIFATDDLAGISAACLLIEARIFDELGGFPAEFFAYLEDVDLCLRLKENGFTFGIATDITVDHQHLATSGQMGTFKQRQDLKNWCRLIHRHWSFWQKLRYALPIAVERLRNLNGLLKTERISHRQKQSISTTWNSSRLNFHVSSILDIILTVISKVFHLLFTDPQKILSKINRQSLYHLLAARNYEHWITQKEAALPLPQPLSYTPTISVLVPVYNVAEEYLVACIESVIAQIYPRWELCLVDDASTDPTVRKTLARYADHPHIKIKYRSQNGHISQATNDTLKLATGDFVALLDCDDTLSPRALYEVAAALNKNPDLDWIYTDEDKISADGTNRHFPHFKPDWSPDTLMSHMYTCHLSVYRRNLIEKIDGLRVGYEGSQDYDLSLRFSEVTTPDKIYHIPQILYHWRERPESTAGDSGAKPYVYDAARRAKLDACKRRHTTAQLASEPVLHQEIVVYDVIDEPLVSIIIPSKDHPDLLERCLTSLTQKTSYHRYEIIIVDNGSTLANKNEYERLAQKYSAHYLYQPQPFNFAAMCNRGVKKSHGDYLFFLNDDTEIVNTEWLTVMLGYAQRQSTGAVGIKMLYPDGHTIQNAGIVNLPTGPTHLLTGSDDRQIQYFGRNRLTYNVSAVSGAGLLVAREKYQQIGGMDEGFPIAYNDVDLCWRLLEAGYFNVIVNHLYLFHHESASRGHDHEDTTKKQRLAQELEKLYTKHPHLRDRDPYYNENFSPMRPDFSYGE